METTMDPAYSYEGETLIHTDPATGFAYKWDVEEKKWVPKTNTDAAVTTVTAPSGEGPATASAPEDCNYEKVGDTYIYKDPKTGQVLEWDLQVKEWRPKIQRRTRRTSNEEEFDSDDDGEAERERLQQKKADIGHHVQVHADGTRTYTDPTDGTVFEWDVEKKAWFPRLDDEFIARYQLSYGENAATPAVEEQPKVDLKKQKEETRPNKTEKPQNEPPTWFEVDESKNTKVYVTNLPLDIDEQGVADFMQKCGMIEKDLETGKLKIKLYRDVNGQVKGDALCTYIKVESVELALKILDGSVLGGKTVGVERAKFTLKGEYDPTKKPRKRKKKDLKKLKEKQQKLFDWRPEKLRGERSKHECVVVLKRLFKPEEFDTNPAMLLEYQKDLREECSKFGRVKKVIIYDRNEEGAAQVFFKIPEDADRCVEVLHGRWFAGQKITAETWDGVTKYRKDETEEEKAERLKKWAEFLSKEEAEGSDSDDN